ncbi:hypothetical protein MRX96_031095 [Rhipicephalus microplus]
MKLVRGCRILLTRRETSARRLLSVTPPHIGHVQKAVHPFLPGIHLCPVSTAIHPLHECVSMAKGATRPFHLSLGVDRTLHYPNGTKPANLLPLDSVFSYERLKNPLMAHHAITVIDTGMMLSSEARLHRTPSCCRLIFRHRYHFRAPG